MAEFESRARELAERFAIIRPSLAAADADLVSAALKRHGDLRSGCMMLLCEVAEDKGDDKKEEAFNSRLESASRDVLAVLNGLLDGIKEPGATLRAFRDIAASEEAKFFEGIKKLKPGATRDTLMRYSHDLEWLVVTMRAKWQNLSGTEKALLQKERLYAGQMRELMKKVYEESVPDYLTTIRDGLDYVGTIEKTKSQINDGLKEKTKEALEKRGKDATVAQVMLDLVRPGTNAVNGVYTALAALNPMAAALLKAIGKAAKNLEPFVQAVIDQQAEEIKSSLGSARTVIVSFSQTRRQAADYVRSNGYGVAKQYLENAKKELADFVSAQPGSSAALKEEAQLFADYAQSAWLYFIEAMRIHHETFVREFQGIFVDSVSEETLNGLTDKPYLSEFANGITGYDLDQKLNQIYGQLIELHGNLDRAFGSLTQFADQPVEAQAMLQEQVRVFQEQVQLPFTREMQEELRKLDAARGKKPKTIAELITSLVNEMVQDSLRETGAPSSG